MQGDYFGREYWGRSNLLHHYKDPFRIGGVLIGFIVASYIAVDWLPSAIPGRGFIILVMAIEFGEYTALVANHLIQRRLDFAYFDVRYVGIALIVMCFVIALDRWVFALADYLLPKWMRHAPVQPNSWWQSLFQ